MSKYTKSKEKCKAFTSEGLLSLLNGEDVNDDIDTDNLDANDDDESNYFTQIY